MFNDNSPKVTSDKLKVIPPVLDIFREFLKSLDSKQFFSSQINVLTHNDMIHGNILWNIEKEKYQLIDFEYSGFNLLGADIINLCLESAYEYDTAQWPFFEREFPLIGSDEHMDRLIHHYIAYLKLYLIRRARESGTDYASKIPASLLENLELDLKDPELAKEEGFLDSSQTDENSSNFEKSKAFLSVKESQKRFVKR